MNHSHCQHAHTPAGEPCATRLSWQKAAADPACVPALSPQARAWIAGVPWYEECVAHAWAHRTPTPAGGTPDLLQSVAEVRHCCECLLWGTED